MTRHQKHPFNPVIADYDWSGVIFTADTTEQAKDNRAGCEMRPRLEQSPGLKLCQTERREQSRSCKSGH